MQCINYDTGMERSYTAYAELKGMWNRFSAYLYYIEWRIHFLYFVRLANNELSVVRDLLECLDEPVAQTREPGPITRIGDFSFFLPLRLISRIRTLIVVPVPLVLLAGGIDLASRLTAGC